MPEPVVGRRRVARLIIILLCVVVLGSAALAVASCRAETPWSAAEKDALRALWLGSLKPLPPDPSNAVADDPRAVALGHRLFFDTRFSSNGLIACASCHVPDKGFQDGRPLGVGLGATNRRTMTVVGTAYSPWLFWDGRKDSQWSQALGPLENAVEHGGSRTQYAHLIAQHYKAEYESLFGPLPDLSDPARFPPQAGPVDDAAAKAAWEAMAPADRDAVNRVFANMGKAIAAYERQIMPGPSRFDSYVAGVLQDDAAAQKALLPDEIAGLRLFIGRANCTQCHNGPLFTNNSFHATGVPPRAGLPRDVGRAKGARDVQADEFNCLSKFSDAGQDDCQELLFMTVSGPELIGQFKPPTLRNIAENAPYMHAGQFATLREALDHYNTAPAGPFNHTDLKPLNLTDKELGQLEAFLRTLSGPLATPPDLLKAPALP
ncbi:MAG: cytochrome c peroxidase [Anaerolineae bacterium]